MTKKNSEEEKFVSVFDAAAMDLSPPFNHYTGRDTSVFAMTEFAPSMTQQEFAVDADINSIMAKYVKTGTVPVYMDKQPFYVDASEYPSYQDMQNILINARDAFEALPAKVREQFGNDPARFVEYASDEKNTDQLREWGMLSPEAVERLDAAKAAEAAKAADRVQAAAKAAGASSEAGSPAESPS